MRKTTNDINTQTLDLQCSMLFMLFLGLKLTGHIDWSWWWVTAPLWLPLLLIFLFFAIAIAVAKWRAL